MFSSLQQLQVSDRNMQPINNQPGVPPQPPGPGTWMAPPSGGAPGVPPGLEYLSMIDQVLAHQVVEILQMFTGWETNNKYAIKNNMGQQMYYAFEDTDTCMRICCGPSRGFTIKIVDNYQKEVMRIIRPFKCCAGCCWCAGSDGCAHEVTVEAPPGNIIGMVKQVQSKCGYSYHIMSADGRPQLFIEGPNCPCRCCADVDFPVYTLDKGQQVGKISKQWSGFAREAFTTSDNFGVQFPMDLDVKTKATMIGALFLIDFMVFEQQKNDNNSN